MLWWILCTNGTEDGECRKYWFWRAWWTWRMEWMLDGSKLSGTTYVKLSIWTSCNVQVKQKNLRIIVVWLICKNWTPNISKYGPAAWARAGIRCLMIQRCAAVLQNRKVFCLARKTSCVRSWFCACDQSNFWNKQSSCFFERTEFKLLSNSSCSNAALKIIGWPL